jgi:hypothetical protein
MLCGPPLKRASPPLGLPDSSEFHCQMSERHYRVIRQSHESTYFNLRTRARFWIAFPALGPRRLKGLPSRKTLRPLLRVKIQTEFMETQMNSVNEQAKILSEIYSKATQDAMKISPSTWV